MERTRELCLVLTLLSLTGTSVAQEGPLTFEFSFSNPGARSMGIGGAFAALADDATAAFANPAGLVQLVDPEVSLEGRSWSYDTPFVTAGRASGLPTGVGIDTFAGVQYGVSGVDLQGLSFLSFVYPGRGWAVAVYRHRWANFKLARQVNGLFGDLEGEVVRAEDILAETDFGVTNNGVAGAYEITKSLSVGGGLVYYQANMDSVSREFAVDDAVFFGANDGRPEHLDTTYRLDGEDSGLSVHGGLSWRPTPGWFLGAFARQGPRLTMDVTEVVGPANDELPDGTVEVEDETGLSLPSVYGLGLAHRMLDGALTLSFEWSRVRYSTITESLNEDVFDQDQIALSDGNELRFGAEYVFVTARPAVALRFGAFRDPAHGLDSGPEADQFERAIFDGGEAQTHFAGGGGVVFERFQIDLGFDLSEHADLLSISFVYRF